MTSGDTGVTVILPPQDEVIISFGPVAAGTMIQLLLLGIICSQAAVYFCHHFTKDSQFNRRIVSLLVLLNVLLSAFDINSMYASAVLDYGQFENYDKQPWSTYLEPILTTAITFIAHIFYLFRCWTVTRSSVVIVFLMIGVLLALSGGIATSVGCFMAGRLSRIYAVVFVPAVVWLASTAVADICFAVVLVVYLLHHDAPLRSTSAMFARLRRTAIETGSFTAFFALINLIIFVAMPHAGYYFLVQYSMAHIYTISVLYTLLGRQELRDILSSGSGTMRTGLTLNFQNLSTRTTRSGLRFTVETSNTRLDGTTTVGGGDLELNGVNGAAAPCGGEVINMQRIRVRTEGAVLDVKSGPLPSIGMEKTEEEEEEEEEEERWAMKSKFAAGERIAG